LEFLGSLAAEAIAAAHSLVTASEVHSGFGGLKMTSTMRKGMTAEAEEDYSSIFLFFGIALVILGAIAIASSTVTTIGSVVVFGGILLAAGLAESIHSFRARRRDGVLLNVLSAVLYLVVGAMLLSSPLAGALSLTLVISAFLFAAGIIRFAYCVTHRAQPHWGWFLFGGIVDVALAILIAAGWPATGFWVIGLFVGIELMFYGFATIAVSFAIKNLSDSINAIEL
jgi:uncharacterized membrane protein HdeD (DUF308 family)